MRSADHVASGRQTDGQRAEKRTRVDKHVVNKDVLDDTRT